MGDLALMGRAIVVHVDSDTDLKRNEREVCRAIKEKAIEILQNPGMVGRLEQIIAEPGTPNAIRKYVVVFDIMGKGPRIIQ